VAVAGFVCSAGATADAWADYLAAKQKALAPLQADYDRIVAAHRDDPAIQKYRERLGLVDEVAGRILRGLDAISAASAAGIAGSALGDLGGTEPPSADAGGLPVPDALRLLAEYGSAFEEELLVPDLTQEGQNALRTYADLSMSAASAQVAERAQMVHASAPTEELARQTLCLAVALPLLGTRDDRWSPAVTEALPDWVRVPASYGALEAFALLADRPLTAYLFSPRGLTQTAEPESALDYLRSAAKRMAERRDYRAASCCLIGAMAIAKEAGQNEMAMSLGLEQAEALSMGGNHGTAAEQAQRLLVEYPSSGQYGKAVVLRLRYLYLEGGDGDVLEGAQVARRDQKCRGSLPQVLYLAWAASRRGGQAQSAVAIRTELLERFSEHPLAADVYLVSAMDALANMDIRESSRLLSVLRDRFPNYEYMPQVADVVRRVDRLVGRTQ
jgi:hypothetical protein